MNDTPRANSRTASPSADSSVIHEEIERFSALAEEWWNPKGPMAPLHAMNPVRTEWVRKTLDSSCSGIPDHPTLLDIGCGAGLASESFARLGFDTMGVDASEKAIEAARSHQKLCPLPPSSASLSYRCGNAEVLVEERKQFDVVCALEIIEHVRDPEEFLHLLFHLTKPNGHVVISTMNRTIRSFLMAKLGAEYILRMLPIGTHQWQKFIKPVELDRMAQLAGLRLTHISGLSYYPPRWQESRDLSINYIALFARD
ncbi:bifunctional 2-polyprenyl-6-hydroxyphenol methylase/3-demethylubiquinol 3-O-methyltransferase UbiG [Acetobacteraceae bacterium ESL0709]|nr:bifunctional 2-polyprenyl-6-hydroxyphenol methylase/3-demethylubiquinol 3-O-methyltransferase UbiG [Acetobacteraceae bacterium ESL0697]MDF7678288.1 bifunctional 2-polyprenyl-6-hydroxyphenol methylase/3-demethylubiquinol 3-O-methyltransferase UbiG [Acetobacteraceae bacterium ESL0709]